MAPIMLKFTDDCPSLLGALVSTNERQKAWQVCTKAKDALENGSRLENMSWRLWFVHNSIGENKGTDVLSSYQINRGDNNDSIITEPTEPTTTFSTASITTKETVTTPFTSTLPGMVDIYRQLLWQQQLGQFQQQCILKSIDDWTENDVQQQPLIQQQEHQQDHQEVENVPPRHSVPQNLSSSNGGKARKKNTSSIIRRIPHNHGNSPMPISCTNCRTTDTPLWRRSADDQLLCNACGLYLKLHNAPRPKHLKPNLGRRAALSDSEESMKQQRPQEHLTCTNCATTATPLWRRDENGCPLCNACGLYLKLHHVKRPLSLKSSTIRKRQRGEPTLATAATTMTIRKSKFANIIQFEPATTLAATYYAPH